MWLSTWHCLCDYKEEATPVHGQTCSAQTHLSGGRKFLEQSLIHQTAKLRILKELVLLSIIYLKCTTGFRFELYTLQASRTYNISQILNAFLPGWRLHSHSQLRHLTKILNDNCHYRKQGFPVLTLAYVHIKDKKATLVLSWLTEPIV